MNTIAPDIDAAQRRTLRVLVAAQILSGAGLAAGITVGALLAQDMLDSTGLAGLPSALFTIGSAAAAATVGRLSQRLGRRAGLASGYAAGALGSLGVVAAATLDNIPLLFIALFVYGPERQPTSKPVMPEPISQPPLTGDEPSVPSWSQPPSAQ